MENQRNTVCREDQYGLQTSYIVLPFVFSSIITITPQNEEKGESSDIICRHTKSSLPKSILNETTAGATFLICPSFEQLQMKKKNQEKQTNKKNPTEVVRIHG